VNRKAFYDAVIPRARPVA